MKSRISTTHPSARDPYFLYAASNAGSLAALLAYPLWIERRLRLGEQSAAWGVGFAIVAAMVAFCGVATILEARKPVRLETEREATPTTDLAAWVVLAMVPSSLMLGVTTYLTNLNSYVRAM